MLVGALLCLGLVARHQTSSQYVLRNHSSTLFASTTAAAEEVTVGMHASALGQYLQGLMDREVGAPLLQSLLNQLPYSSHPRNDSQTVFEISTALEARVTALTSMVRELRDASEQLPSFPSSLSCCSLPPGQTRHHARLGAAVQERPCQISSLPAAVSPSSKIVPIPSKLTSLLRNHLSTPGLLWQVFLDPSGREVIYPSPRTSCTSTSPHSHLLPLTLHPFPRRTIILLDTAASLSPSQFRLAISAARYMLSSLNPLDQAAVFLTSTSRALSPLNCQAEGSLLPPPLLLPLLDQLVSSSINAQLLPAFTSALGVLFNSTAKPLPAQIVVISTLNRLTAASSSLQHATASLPSTSTAAVLLGLPQTIPLDLIQPHYVISTSTHISAALEGWYQAPSPHSSLTPHFSPLQVDPLTSLPTVALTLPSPVGVVGLIVDLRALAEEVIFQSSTVGERVFLIDSEGKIVAESGPSGGELTKFEPEKLSPQLQSKPVSRKRLGVVDYTWRKVQGSPFSVVLASPANAPKEVRLKPMFE